MFTNMYDINVDDTMYSIPEYIEHQQQPVTQQDDTWMCNSMVSGTSKFTGELII